MWNTYRKHKFKNIQKNTRHKNMLREELTQIILKVETVGEGLGGEAWNLFIEISGG